MTDPALTSPSVAPPAGDLAVDNAPTFDVLPLSRELRETLVEMGYVHPTPVQIAVWEPATRGRDAVVQARTGTGKTAAFGLPIVDHIVKRSSATVQVLALCPTRELAIQVAAEVERLGAKKAVKVTAIYGGAGMQNQIDAIKNGAQVVVGTPGRVLDHLRRGTLDPKFVRLVVLDESDEMLSMGFERELTAILETLPPERQTLLFSATLPPDIERIAKNKLKNPDFLTLSGDHVGALSIKHFVYMVVSDKIGALIRVLEVENPESAVIFCNTKDETQNVAGALKRKGFDADWLNGDLPQNDREKVMRATREGRLRYLVATDVAARGIDISHLTHVINHDFPQDAEAYVHRTGRTGRAGRTGTAVSLVMPQDIGSLYMLRLTYKIRPLEKQIPTTGELKTRAEADLVTMFAEAFVGKTTHPDDLALARRLLTHDQCDVILAGLLRDHLGARPDVKQEAAAARKAPRPVVPERAPQQTAPSSRAPSRTDRESPRGRPGSREDTPRTDFAAATDSPPSPQPTSLEAAATLPGGRIARPRDASEGRPARVREGDREAPRGREPRRDSRDDRRREPVRGRELRAAPEASSEAEAPRARRASELASWQPPVEEGDDDPILAGGPIAPSPTSSEASPVLEGDWAEIYINIGRREGARALDVQRVLVERGGIDKAHVQRIRVRDRNAFASVPRADLDRAMKALTGAEIAGKIITPEIARSSSDEGARRASAPRGEAAPKSPTEPDDA